MGCGATKEAPAVEAPPAEPRADKMKFRQATVLDLLADENAENDRILLQWAGKVFDQFDADHNGCLVCTPASPPFRVLSRCLQSVFHVLAPACTHRLAASFLFVAACFSPR